MTGNKFDPREIDPRTQQYRAGLCGLREVRRVPPSPRRGAVAMSIIQKISQAVADWYGPKPVADVEADLYPPESRDPNAKPGKYRLLANTTPVRCVDGAHRAAFVCRDCREAVCIDCDCACYRDDDALEVQP